jgi:hypothetical protein
MEENLREALGRAFRELHERLREEVRGLDAGTLNWRPLPKANSVAVLVTHTVGSELEMIRAVRSNPTARDRDSEFRAESDAAQLLEMIDAADREMGEQIAALTPSDITDPRPRGDRPPQPGIYWLLTNYGHAREHLAQIELTKQLYDSRT